MITAILDENKKVINLIELEPKYRDLYPGCVPVPEGVAINIGDTYDGTKFKSITEDIPTIKKIRRQLIQGQIEAAEGEINSGLVRGARELHISIIEERAAAAALSGGPSVGDALAANAYYQKLLKLENRVKALRTELETL